MTEELGKDYKISIFNYTVKNTEDTANNKYIQRLYNAKIDKHAVQIREKRYSTPTVIAHDLDNLKDAEQLLQVAENQGITEIMQALEQ